MRRLILIFLFLGILFSFNCGNNAKKQKSETEEFKVVDESYDPYKSENSQEKGPKIGLSEKKFNFGNVWEGTELSHVFKFKNIGDQLLKIDRVKAGWGCTATLLSEKEVKPGMFGTVKVVLKTHGKHGNLKKKIYIESNDTSKPKHEIEVEADVKVAIMIEPSKNSRLSFRNLYKGDEKTETFSLKAFDKKTEFKITDVIYPKDIFKVEYETEIKGMKYNFKVTTLKTVKSGTFKEKIKIKTDLDIKKEIEIHSYVEIKGDLEFSKRYFYVNGNNTGKFKEEIELINKKNEPFNILEFKLDLEGVEVTKTKLKNNGYKFTFNFTKDVQLTKKLDSKFQVKTDVDMEEDLILNVRGRILDEKEFNEFKERSTSRSMKKNNVNNSLKEVDKKTLEKLKESKRNKR